MPISSSPIQQAQGSQAAGNNTISVTIAAPGVGNALVVEVAIDDETVTVSTISGGGCTWSRARQNTANATSKATAEIWIGENSTGVGTSLSIQLSGTIGEKAANVSEWSGIAASSSLDQTQVANGSSVSPVSGTTGNTTQADELVIGMAAVKSTTAPSAGPTNSFSALTTATQTTLIQALGAYRVVNATGAYSTGWTITSARWAGAIATFKAAPPSTTAVTRPGFTLSPNLAFARTMPWLLVQGKGVFTFPRAPILAGGITSAEAFGTANVLRILGPGGVAAGEAFGVTRASRILAPVAIGSAAAFGTPRFLTISQAGKIASAEAFGVPRLLFVVSPVGAVSAAGFGTTVLRRLLAPVAITTAEAFGTTRLSRLIGPGGVASATVFGTTKAIRILAVTGTASAEAFGVATVFTIPGGVSAVGAIASLEAFGTAKVIRILAAIGAAPATAFGTTTVIRRLGPTGIASAVALGQNDAVVRVLAAVGIATGEQDGQPRLTRIVAPTGTVSGEQFGTTRPTRLLFNAGAISSAAAVGTPGAVRIVANTGAIASTSALGAPQLRRIISQAGIAPGEAFGVASVIRYVRAVNITTGEQFGTAVVFDAGIVTPSAFGRISLADTEAFQALIADIAADTATIADTQEIVLVADGETWLVTVTDTPLYQILLADQPGG